MQYDKIMIFMFHIFNIWSLPNLTDYFKNEVTMYIVQRNTTNLQLLESKFRHIDDLEKYRLFEEAIDYIRTYDLSDQANHLSIEQLLLQILCIEPTSCRAFYKYSFKYKLNYFNRCFGPLLPSYHFTREITYFVVTCYIKYLCFENKNLSFNAEDICLWLNETLGTNIDNTIKTNMVKYVNEVKIKDGIVCFECNHHMRYQTIKLNTLTSYSNVKLNISKKATKHTYNNNQEPGLCLGLAKYWLDNRARADTFTTKQKQRVGARQEFANSLSWNNLDKIQYELKESNHNLTQDFLLQEYFFHNLYSSVDQWSTALNTICSILQKNRLQSIYALVTTDSHALALSVVKKGTGLKFAFYEPNSKTLHSRIFVPNNRLLSMHKDHDLYNGFSECFKSINSGTQLLIKLYSPQKPDVIDTQYPIISTNTGVMRQLLMLGIANMDYKLIQNILQDFEDTDSLILFCKDATTPLHFAVRLAITYHNTQILELLISHIKKDKINFYNKDGLTALDTAYRITAYTTTREDVIALLELNGALKAQETKKETNLKPPF